MHAFVLELEQDDMNSMSSKDEDWVQGPSNSKSKLSENCIIHGTDENDNLAN